MTPPENGTFSTKIAQEELNLGPLEVASMHPLDTPPPTRHIQAAKDIFGPGSNMAERYVQDYKAIARYSDALKGLRQKVVYTMGVWDLVHIGHCRYFEKAKDSGDFLIVGVELDEAIRIRKGPRRPVIPFAERLEMLCHLRHVDLVVPVSDYDSRGLSGMGLLEAIRPDVMIASERSFNEANDTAQWLDRARLLCGEVVILHSQAETSTSAKLRSLTLDVGQMAKQSVQEAKKAMEDAFEDLQSRIEEAIDKA